MTTKVRSPTPTPEQTQVLEEYQKALAELSETSKKATEFNAKVGAEVVRRKSMPQMRALTLAEIAAGMAPRPRGLPR